MKVVQLIKHGNTASCFEIREIEKPRPAPDEVLIKIQAFGLNYADAMARRGLYQDAPPLPSVLGYDVVGIIEQVGEGCDKMLTGKRVVAVTHFGGYAEYAVAKEFAVAEVPLDMPPASATALATQYGTAHYAAFTCCNIQEGDRVFIHAAAGGVGLALIQFCKLKNCTIYGAVSNEQKADVIRRLGVQFVINTSTQNVYEELKKLADSLDVVFDSVGGKGVGLGYKALRAGGRIVCYGGSQLMEGRGLLNYVKFGVSFGLYSPIQFLTSGKSMMGINMLKVMLTNPRYLQLALKECVKMVLDQKIIMPVGQSFPVSEVFKAQQYLESRKSIGKLVVEW